MVVCISSVRRKAPISRFSSTDIEGNTLLVCGTNAIPLATRACGVSPVMSAPSSTTRPPRSVSMPNRAFMAVDLPAPLGPTTTAISPLATATVQSCRMSAAPYPPVMLAPIKNGSLRLASVLTTRPCFSSRSPDTLRSPVR